MCVDRYLRFVFVFVFYYSLHFPGLAPSTAQKPWVLTIPERGEAPCQTQPPLLHDQQQTYSLVCCVSTWHILGTQYIAAGIIAFFFLIFLLATSLASRLPIQANLLPSQTCVTPQATCLMTPSLWTCCYTCLVGPLHLSHLKNSYSSFKTLFMLPFLWEAFPHL